jgi:riboflavin synthase
VSDTLFTGLVREVGTVVGREGGEAGVRLEVGAPQTAAGVNVGDSVAIDGVCLTVVAVADGSLAFDAVPETLARTTLGGLEPGRRVNLEPALRVGEALGGHFVQGHVDCVAHVRSVEPDGDGRRVWFDAPPELLRYLVEKGSVAVQGVSLTVSGVEASAFEAALIPHTLAATVLGALGPGDAVNVECDVLAKHVEKLLAR